MTTLSYSSIEQVRNFLEGKTDMSQLYEWLVEGEYDSALLADEPGAPSPLRRAVLDTQVEIAGIHDVREVVRQVLEVPTLVVNLVGDSGFTSSSSNAAILSPTACVTFGRVQPVRYERIQLGTAS